MSVVCYLVSPIGFCSGVNRAVNMAEQVLKFYKEIYITEDIIHNKVFMNEMIANGAIKVCSIEDIPDGKVVMFSAHGVSPKIISACEKKGLTIIDGTCPIVASVQQLIKQSAKEEKAIVIIGNRSHSEIVGMVGCAENKNVFVVANELEVDLLPSMEGLNVVYYTQTTMDEYLVEKVVATLKAKIPHIESEKENNICCATAKRQNVVKSIASEVDLMIVVGSKYSSNTMQLVEVATRAGARQVIRVDSVEDLEHLKFLKSAKSIGIASGSSTPEYVVQEIVEHLKNVIENLDIHLLEGCNQNCNEE